MKKFTATLEAGVGSIRQSAAEVLEARQDVRHLADIRAFREQQLEDLQRETRFLAERLRQLVSLINQEGLTDLERRIERIATRLAKKKTRSNNSISPWGRKRPAGKGAKRTSPI